MATPGTMGPSDFAAQGYNTMPVDNVKKKSRGPQAVGQIAVLVIAPFTAFSIVALVFGFMAYYSNTIAYMVYFLIGLLALAPISSPVSQHRYQGYLASWGCFCGYIVGQYNYGAFISPYWSLSHRITYTNVVPTQPANALEDAGLISYENGTFVDTRRVLGHASPLLDKRVYCVAPILDASQSDKVNYWAVGHDCCQSMWGFNCGEVHNPKARSGIVYFESDGFFAWHDWKRFTEAAKQAAAFYGFLTPEAPVFVTWVEDPEYHQQLMWNHGLMWLGITHGIYFVFSVLIAALLYFCLEQK